MCGRLSKIRGMAQDQPDLSFTPTAVSKGMVMPTQTHEVQTEAHHRVSQSGCIKYGSQSPTNRVIAHSAPSGTPSGCIFIRLDYRLRGGNETPTVTFGAGD